MRTKQKDVVFVLLLTAAFILINILFFRSMGMIFHDTGKELSVPLQILEGKLLYRDIHWLYGPFAPYFSAFLYWIFGVHMDVLLIASCIMGFLICLAVYWGIRHFAKPGYAIAGAFMVFGFSITSNNFAFPYSFAILWATLMGLVAAIFWTLPCGAGVTLREIRKRGVPCNHIALNDTSQGNST